MNYLQTHAYLVESHRGNSIYLDSERAHQAAQTLRGSVSPLIKTESAWHIIYALELEQQMNLIHIEALKNELDAVKSQLRDIQS